MAIKQPKPQPEYQLKHRLAGAAIIVSFAVLIIPLLLKEPPIENTGDINTVSEETNGAFVSKIQPLITDSPVGAEPQQGEETEPALPDVDQDVDQSADQEHQQDSSATQQGQLVMTVDAEQETASPEAENEAAGVQVWVVRVGTFTKIENVNSLSTLLESSGFEAKHTKVQTALGQATRVWLGPYPKKELAEKISAQLKILTGEKGYVTLQTAS